MVFGYAGELIGNESEPNLIRCVKTAKDFKDGAAETRVPGWISRKGGSKVRTVQITGGRAKRGKGRIANSGRISVAPASWSGPGVGFANSGDRSPKIITIL